MGGMPQVSVEYSESLAAAFDRRGFALALHTGGGEVIGSAVSAFKTRFRTTGETVIADGDPGEAMIHIEMGILPGRDAETKDRLGELTLALLADHLGPTEGLNIQLTVEIRDLANYHKRVVTVS
jgi:5-carboxymethyl-2-hydroxymuconate isomerase